MSTRIRRPSASTSASTPRGQGSQHRIADESPRSESGTPIFEDDEEGELMFAWKRGRSEPECISGLPRFMSSVSSADQVLISSRRSKTIDKRSQPITALIRTSVSTITTKSAEIENIRQLVRRGPRTCSRNFAVTERETGSSKHVQRFFDATTAGQ